MRAFATRLRAFVFEKKAKSSIPSNFLVYIYLYYIYNSIMEAEFAYFFQKQNPSILYI